MPEPRTITEAAELIRRGELTPVELLDQCLARVDRYESKVRAWVVLDREGAREQAERLTAELKAGQNRGPLHGIPVGIKDIIDVFDLPTGCGSKLWANSYARRDATCVARLRQAGAVILGKTVTTAFAYMDPPVTRNPWNLDRTPGGSSSGSAAAVACGMCLGALGTQTGGSVTRPASFCGVCSLKPTHGRISVDGVLPFAPSLDHVGVMANCVRDLAILFEVVAGTDPRDPSSADKSVPDFTWSFPDPPDPQRVAVLGGLFYDRAEPTIRGELAALVQRITGIGGLATTDQHETVPTNVLETSRVALPAVFNEVTARHLTVMAVEAAAYHCSRFVRHPEDYPPKITWLIQLGLGMSASEYAACKAHQAELSKLCDLVLNHFHALLTPATSGPAPTPETTGNPLFNSPWSYTGLPTISIPYGWTADGLPLALQLIGRRWGEEELLAIGADWERVRFEPRPLPL